MKFLASCFLFEIRGGVAGVEPPQRGEPRNEVRGGGEASPPIYSVC
jgi:hypothetical protein